MIIVPLATRDQGTGRAALAAPVSALLALDVRVDRARYHLVSAAHYMLVCGQGSCGWVAVLVHNRCCYGRSRCGCACG